MEGQQQTFVLCRESHKTLDLWGFMQHLLLHSVLYLSLVSLGSGRNRHESMQGSLCKSLLLLLLLLRWYVLQLHHCWTCN